MVCLKRVKTDFQLCFKSEDGERGRICGSGESTHALGAVRKCKPVSARVSSPLTAAGCEAAVNLDVSK